VILVTRWFRLRDRFGDNGIIGVMLGACRRGATLGSTSG
jgi:predicted enzyme involved in methoxymalonyl-ACP biosynthesis